MGSFEHGQIIEGDAVAQRYCLPRDWPLDQHIPSTGPLRKFGENAGIFE